MSDSGSRPWNVYQRFVVGALTLILFLVACYVAMRLRWDVHEEFKQNVAKRQYVVQEEYDQSTRELRRDMMLRQIRKVGDGQIDCLVNPDPLFLNQLFADADCTKNLSTIYMGRDVSDPRLSRLRDLPNLQSIVFFWTQNPEVFLEHLQGKVEIKALSFDMSEVSCKGVQYIASLPNLDSLCMPIPENLACLERLKGHKSLENLVLTRASADEQLIPILQGMPHLRRLTIHILGNDVAVKEFEGQLSRVLPACECSVTGGYY